MKKFIFVLALAKSSSFAFAQEVPPAVNAMLESKSHVIKRGSLSTAHKNFLLKDTSVSEDGYLLINGPKEYSEIISDVTKLPEFKNSDSAKGSKSVIMGYRFVGFLDESSNRKSLVYRGSRGQLMLTTWKFAADGARIIQAEEMLNADVNKVPGTLSLTISTETTAMWKLTWKTADTLYELYVEDMVSRHNRPSLSASQVLEIGRTINN
jgi:hypothetical protein